VDWLSPYKGLAPFEDSELDAAFFFGRDREQGVITANLTAARLTLLYGLSGVGKSSILRAGVVRRLRALPGPLAVVVFDRWRDDPGQRLRDDVAAVAGMQPEGSLADTIEATCARLGGELYVILDGAEEYFVYHGGENEPGTFAADFPDAVTRPALRAFFLLSLREDALAALDPFKSRIPSLYANSLRLEHLDREAARDAILGPLDQYNRMSPDAPVGIEPELVEAVLDQVATGKVDVGRGRGGADGAPSAVRVETPYLSLVMERLWEVEQAAGSRFLRLSTLAALGGAQQIVRVHLDDALDMLPAASQEAAAEVFNHLVTPSGTKIAHTVADLADYASVREGELEPVLQVLASERILRPVAGTDDSARYEIFHDVLAGAVLAWRSAYGTKRALATERRASHKRTRRLLIVIAVALVLLTAMVGVTIFALSQRNDARTQARHALARALSGDALKELGIDPELSMLLGVEAAKREPSPAVEDVLRQAFTASRARAVLAAGGKPVRAVEFSPDGKLLAVGSADGSIRLFTVRGQLTRRLRQGGPVTSMSFSKNGALVLGAGKDGSARIWRTRDGAPVHVLRHDRAVESAAFSPDASLVVTASDDRTARIWRTADGTQLQVLHHPHAVVGAVFDPAHRRVATVSGGEVRIFDVASGQELHQLAEAGVTSVAFSPDGALLATASNDHTARLWSAASGQLVHRFEHYRARVVGVAFTHDGDRLVTAGTDGAARVWDVRAGQRVAVIGRQEGIVTRASFSPAEPEEPDAKWVVTSSRDGTAQVAKAESGAQWARLLGHKGPVTTATFSPDGRLVATGSEDGTARVWDANTYPQLSIIGRHEGPANTASFSPDGTLAVSAGDDGTARIWRIRDRSLLAGLRTRGRVTDASFSPDGKLVVTASADGTARLWTSAGRPLRTLHHRGPVRTAAFSTDGRLLVTASADGTARVWRVSDGKPLHVLRVGAGPVVKASFSHDARFVVAIGAELVAQVFRTEDGKALSTLGGHTGPLVDASFSPDDTKVVTASVDHTAQLWNARTARLLHVLKGHRGPLTSAEFSPDGTLVVTASRDSDARVWDVATGTSQHTLRAHFGPVNKASFSPDGRWIVTAGPGAAGLWPTSTGVLEAYLFGSKHPLRTATFSLNGRRILTAGVDGTVRIDRCDVCGTLPELVALSEQRLAHLGRTLSPTERARYLGD